MTLAHTNPMGAEAAVARPARLDAAAEAYASRVRLIGLAARAWGAAAGSAAGLLGWLLLDLALPVPAPLRLLALPVMVAGGWAGWRLAADDRDAAERGVEALERAAGVRGDGRFRGADELARPDAAGAAGLRRRAIKRGDAAAAGLGDAAALADTAPARRARGWLGETLLLAALFVVLLPTAAAVSLGRMVRPLTELPGWTPHAFAVEPRRPLVAGEPATLEVTIRDAWPWWVSMLGLAPEHDSGERSRPAVRASLILGDAAEPVPLTRVGVAWGGASEKDQPGVRRFRGRVAAPVAATLHARVESDLGGGRWVSLPVDVSPRVVGGTVTLTPPAYTGRPAKTVRIPAPFVPDAEDAETLPPHLKLRALAGTTVEIAVETRVPLAEISAGPAGVEPTAGWVEGRGATRAIHRSEVTESGDFRVALASALAGGEATEALRLRIDAVPDAPPVAAVGLEPPVVRLAVSQTLDVPLSLRDDVAVAGAGYAEERGVLAAPEEAARPGLSPERDLAIEGSPLAGPGDATAGVSIIPAAMGLVPGDYVRGRVVAEDNRPTALGGSQRSEPAEFGVLIVSDEEMKELLREQRRAADLLEEQRALDDAVSLLDAERERLAETLAGLAARAEAGGDAASLAADREAAAAALRRLTAASDALAEAFEKRADRLKGYGFEASLAAGDRETADAIRDLAAAAQRAAGEQEDVAEPAPDGPPQAPGAPGSVGASADPAGPSASEELADGAYALRPASDAATPAQHDLRRLAAADELFGLRDRLMTSIREQRAIADEAAALRGKPAGEQRDAAYAAVAERQEALEQELYVTIDALRGAAEASVERVPKLSAQAADIADAVEALALEPAFDEAIASAASGSAGPAAAATAEIATALASLVQQVRVGPGQPCDDVCLTLTEAQMQAALDEMAGSRPRPGPGGRGTGTGRGQPGFLASGSGVGTGAAGSAAGLAPGAATAAALAGVHAALAGVPVDGAGSGPGSGRGPGDAGGVALAGEVFSESIEAGVSAPADAASARTAGVAPRYRADAAAYFQRLADEADTSSAETTP
ncbi:hypothetical protein [Phycisphaera mikurensis]|uniref:DUF4175 family protein n=1 Tax=Phycisphaera mikurensis (strain NBRC 102666 / KCTC 22515 / FYK2301M01) TaxID=1142394 RepID=I0IDM7_PHYMF|nr:hypothetical protein [Phycisphaera mikurensis]MBB6441184.1 hypothetical protein [Phycisphaera mikurensis]BAM03365.1 hypothetical protein PSMK_12060 [Phycisphaera mikurensis NBRC 102666]